MEGVVIYEYLIMKKEDYRIRNIDVLKQFFFKYYYKKKIAID